MKKSISITAVFAALLSIAACQQVPEPGQDVSSENGIRLTFTCGDINTKAVKPGVGNENLIKTLDVFLFSNSYPEFRHHSRFSPEIESYFTCFIQASAIADGEYKVFSIANYPGPESDFYDSGNPTTMAFLQALALSEGSHRTFTQEAGGNIMPAEDEDLSLVMTGLAENIHVAPVLGQNLVGKANVELKRLPAKVTMDFYLKDEVNHDKGNVTEVWTPLTEGSNIRVYLCNGTTEALVGGVDANHTLFDYYPNINNTAISGKADFSTAFSSASFYTYPETWSYGSATEPYLKLIVPWKLSRSTSGIVQQSQKEYYYKVMLPTNAFESNNWYHLVLDVTQLGGNADDEAVNVPCGYQVLDWRTGSAISSSMSPGYYLDVNVPDPMDIKFYGNTLDIPYFASGTVAIRSKQLDYEYFRTGTHVTEDPGAAVAKATDGDFIHIDHTLKYDFTTDDYDVSPYTFTIVLQLANDDIGQYDKTLKVTQYPPLYITNTDTYNSANSPSNVYVNNYNATTARVKVWDDSGLSTTSTISATYQPHYLGSINYNLGAVPSFDPNASNQNPNIYSVTTTILKFTPVINGGPFETVLGDPRAAATNEYSSLLNGGDAGNPLTDYRPTDPDAQNVISPKFISASSYGRTYAVSYEGARKRCAAYQESGYPAGRWRLPTKAEILFLQKLNTDNKIPKLYGTSQESGYWAAGHLLFIQDSGGNDTFMTIDDADASGGTSAVTYNGLSGYVRCVYDTWYWGEDPVSGTGWLGYQTSL
ncbi:MAG: hypothetical protein IJR12_07815 [Bacteroidales bacterium]|nr:hypothetical protein [Bacteroidales bacterium]